MIDLAKIDQYCPALRELSVADSVISYKPVNQHESRGLSSLRYLCLSDVTMEGDQGCWKRMVGINNQIIFLNSISDHKVKKGRGLRRITLQNVRLTDADLTDIFQFNKLQYLEEINISATGSINLTEDSIFKLIEKCPRSDLKLFSSQPFTVKFCRLVKIGGICCWSSRDIVSLLETLSSHHHFKIKMDDRD